MATPEWIKKELRANFAKASRAGRQAAKTEPRAASATYRAKDEALHVALTNGAKFIIPVKLIPELQKAPVRDIRKVEVLGRGGGLHWETLDVDISVPGLIASVFEGPTWLAELGRVGGQRSSAAKAAAARKNGRKGGRPRLRVSADFRA
jgi:Protein of unknown function (DUF2442)